MVPRVPFRQGQLDFWPHMDMLFSMKYVDSVVPSVLKKYGTLMSKLFANTICKLLSDLHFPMSKLKRAQYHLQNVISSH